MFVELKCQGGALNGKSGLRDHAVDFGEFFCAEGGRHVELSLTELSAMVRQKVDLGLISADLGFEGFSSDPPGFLVLFADYDVCQAQLTTPLECMRAEISQRLGSLDLLRFADLHEVDERRLDLLRLERNSVMDSRTFDAYRGRAL